MKRKWFYLRRWLVSIIFVGIKFFNEWKRWHRWIWWWLVSNKCCEEDRECLRRNICKVLTDVDHPCLWTPSQLVLNLEILKTCLVENETGVHSDRMSTNIFDVDAVDVRRIWIKGDDCCSEGSGDSVVHKETAFWIGSRLETEDGCCWVTTNKRPAEEDTEGCCYVAKEGKRLIKRCDTVKILF